MAIDKIGQEVNVGDWAAITQHNNVFIGKVIKAGNKSITIAINRMQQFIVEGGVKNARTVKDFEDILIPIFGVDCIKKFGSPFGYGNPDWARDNKFIKINPTRKMELDYENGVNI